MKTRKPSAKGPCSKGGGGGGGGRGGGGGGEEEEEDDDDDDDADTEEACGAPQSGGQGSRTLTPVKAAHTVLTLSTQLTWVSAVRQVQRKLSKMLPFSPPSKTPA